MSNYQDKVLAGRKEFLGQITDKDKEILNIYTEASRQMTLRIKTMKPGSLDAAGQIQLNKAIKEYTAYLRGNIKASVEGGINDAATNAINTQKQFFKDIDPKLDLAQDFNKKFAKINKGVVANMIDGSYYSDGKTLDNRIWHLTKTNAEKIERIIQIHVAKQGDVRDLAKQLDAYTRPEARTAAKTKAIKGMGNASYQAQRLARTSMTHANNEAWVRGTALNPFVVGLKWNLSASHAARMHGVPDECDKYAGQIFKPEEYPVAHPNCLCYPTEATEDPSEARKRLIAWVNGSEDPGLEEWAEKHADSYGINWKSIGKKIKTKDDKIEIPKVQAAKAVKQPTKVVADLTNEPASGIIEVAEEAPKLLTRADRMKALRNIEFEPGDSAVDAIRRMVGADGSPAVVTDLPDGIFAVYKANSSETSLKLLKQGVTDNSGVSKFKFGFDRLPYDRAQAELLDINSATKSVIKAGISQDANIVSYRDILDFGYHFRKSKPRLIEYFDKQLISPDPDWDFERLDQIEELIRLIRSEDDALLMALNGIDGYTSIDGYTAIFNTNKLMIVDDSIQAGAKFISKYAPVEIPSKYSYLRDRYDDPVAVMRSFYDTATDNFTMVGRQASAVVDRNYVQNGFSFEINGWLRQNSIDDYVPKVNIPGNTAQRNDRIYRSVMAIDGTMEESAVPESLLADRWVRTDFLEMLMDQNFPDVEDMDPLALLDAINTGAVSYVDNGAVSVSLMPENNVFMGSPIKLVMQIDEGLPGYVTDNIEESEMVLGRNLEFKVQHAELKYKENNIDRPYYELIVKVDEQQ